jgi:hypothetical protein
MLGALLVPLVLLAGPLGVRESGAQVPPPGAAPPPGPATPVADEPQGLEATPPRVGFISGEVSFLRPGAAEWAPARVNTPLAPGDLLYTGPAGNVEIQIGSRAFVRAAPGTQLGLDNLEPDFVQFRVTSGHVSLDVRDLAAGRTIELDTPNAVFTVERTGYYRVSVGEEATAFITRRGGRATVTPFGGTPIAITPSEHILVTGRETPRVETYVAPELSAWDRWNYARTDYLIEAVSARYVPSGVYGVGDLDRYGAWRVTQDYGAVWVPDSTPPGWAPYSTGRWIWDPRYQWTWVDDAPWGWAPYHYGRWVYLGGFWAWAPGPIVVRPIYAPALVAFFGGFVVGRPVGWVALGWGEPCIPWWGRPGFIGGAWWGGWGGPRIVNNVVIHKTTIVNVKNITVYKNAGVTNAVVAVPHERFGRDPVSAARVTKVDVQALPPVHGALDVKPVPASLVPASGASVRPPDAVHKRPVVATRAPRDVSTSLPSEISAAPSGIGQAPPPRLVPPPSGTDVTAAPARPPFGRQSAPERSRPPEPPRLEGTARPGPARGETRPAPVEGERAPVMTRPSRPEGAGAIAPPAESGRRMSAEPGAQKRGERPGAAGLPPGAVPPPSTQMPPMARPEAPAAQPPSGARTQAPQVQPPPVARPAAPTAPPPATVRTEPPQVQTSPAPRPQTPRAQSPQVQAPVVPSPPRAEAPERQKRPLPGEPANRLFPGAGEKRVERQPDRPQPAKPQPTEQQPARPQPAQQQPERSQRRAEPQAPGSPGSGTDGGGQRGGGRN